MENEPFIHFDSVADDFWSQYADWQGKVFDAYRSSPAGKKDELFNRVTRYSSNLQDMLQAVGSGTRERLLSDYKSLIRFDQIIEDIGLRKETSPEQVIRYGPKITDGGSPFESGPLRARVDPTQLREGHPLAVLWNQLNIQETRFREIKTTTGAAKSGSPFHISTNIPSYDYARMEAARPKIGPNKRMLVFDVETAGLKKEAGIHQLSAYMLETDAEGKIQRVPLPDGEEFFDVRFKTAQMQQGALNVKGRVKRLDVAVREMFGIPESAYKGTVGEGDAFVGEMRKFAELVDQADYVVGHNVKFDIDQILQGLGRTSAFNDPKSGFAPIWERMRTKMSDPEAVVDTQRMFRSMVSEYFDGDMPLAPELAQSRAFRPSSLENIMLQTNMPSLMAEDLATEYDEPIEAGWRRLNRMVGAGGQVGTVHQSDVDIWIESQLLRHMGRTTEDGTPIVRPVSGTAHVLTRAEWAFRESVLTSSAPTPTSFITDVRQVPQEMFEDVVTNKPGSIAVRRQNGTLLSKTEMQRNPDLLYKALQGEKHAKKQIGISGRLNYHMNINALDIQMWDQTNFGLASRQGLGVKDTAFSSGMWREYSGIPRTGEGFLNRAADLFKFGEAPSEESWEAFQKRLAQAGVPWAGQDMPSRWLTATVAEAGAKDSVLTRPQVSAAFTDEAIPIAEAQRRLAAVNADSGLPMFSKIQAPYVTKSKNITLPIEVLEAAERANVIEAGLTSDDVLGQKLSMSVFEGENNAKFANLIFDFEGETFKKRKGQASALAEWLKGLSLDDPLEEGGEATLRGLGFDPDSLGQVREWLPEMGAESGVTIGRLDRKAAEAIYPVWGAIHGGIYDDRAARPLRTYLLGKDDASLTVGAFYNELSVGDGFESWYRKGAEAAKERTAKLASYIENEGSYRAIKTAYDYGFGDTVRKFADAYDVVRSKAPVAIAGAAILGMGALLLSRRREHEMLEETIQEQPIEYGARPPGRPELYEPQEIDFTNRPIGPLDPLATAGVVGNLDRGSVNHALMGPEKNRHLFGGAL